MYALFDSNRVLGLEWANLLLFPRRGATRLAFAQSDRAITRMDGQRLAATVHLAVNLRIAKRSFHGDRDTQADVASASAGIDIRLEVGREHQVHAAVARSNRPARNHLGTWQNARVHAAVARLDVECIETTGNADMAIARVGLHLAIEIVGFNGAISRAQAHVAFEVFDGNAAVVGVQVDRAVQRASFYRPIAGMNVYRTIDGFGLYGPVAGF